MKRPTRSRRGPVILITVALVVALLPVSKEAAATEVIQTPEAGSKGGNNGAGSGSSDPFETFLPSRRVDPTENPDNFEDRWRPTRGIRPCLLRRTAVTLVAPVPGLCRSESVEGARHGDRALVSSGGDISAGPIGTGETACLSGPGVSECPSWVQALTNPDANTEACQGVDAPLGMAVSATSAFITGLTCALSEDGTVHVDIQTVAYDADTGEELWVRRFDGPQHFNDAGLAVAVSPDGRSVFVAGVTDQNPEWPLNLITGDFVTIAYDAATGGQRWISTYASPDFYNWEGQPLNPFDLATAVTVSDDGERVYVTGTSTTLSRFPFSDDAATISYVASTGQQDWAVRYDGPACDDEGDDVPLSIGSLDSRIFVGGVLTASRCPLSQRYQVLALEDDRADHQGRLLWASAHDQRGSPVPGALGVSEQAIVLTGSSLFDCPSGTRVKQYDTVAFEPQTGATKWIGEFRGDDLLGDGCSRRPVGDTGLELNAGSNSTATSLAMSPDGSTVYVAGFVERKTLPPQHFEDFVSGTVAYDAADGEERWVAVTNSPTPGVAERTYSIAVAPDGERLYLAGSTSYQPPFTEPAFKSDYRTSALDASDGESFWMDRYNDSDLAGTEDFDVAYLIGTSPDGSGVVTSGSFIRAVQSEGNFDFYDIGTLGYSRTPTDIDPSPSDSPSPTPSPTSEQTELRFTDRNAAAGQYSDETVFEARLTDQDGDPIPEQEITFEPTGSDSTRTFSAVTDDDGVASVIPVLTEKPGPHQLIVRFAGNESYGSSANTTGFVVDKEDTTLELSVEGKGKKRTLTARLADADSDAGVGERTLDFYGDGELIGSATTDSDGVATLQAPPRYRGGKHDFEARFESDDFYRPSSARERT